jgi:hypothetical protein
MNSTKWWKKLKAKFQSSKVNKPAYAAIKNLEQAMLEGFTDKPPAQATMACIQWFLNGSTA